MTGEKERVNELEDGYVRARLHTRRCFSVPEAAAWGITSLVDHRLLASAQCA